MHTKQITFSHVELPAKMIISTLMGMIGQGGMWWGAGWSCPMGSPQLSTDLGELARKEAKLPKGLSPPLSILAISVPSVERPVRFPPYSLLSSPSPVAPNTSLSRPLIQDITEDEPSMILSLQFGASIPFQWITISLSLQNGKRNQSSTTINNASSLIPRCGQSQQQPPCATQTFLLGILHNDVKVLTCLQGDNSHSKHM